MTADEIFKAAAEGDPIIVARTAAQRWIQHHDMVWAEFLEDCGDRPSYEANEVLEWMGY